MESLRCVFIIFAENNIYEAFLFTLFLYFPSC